MPLQYSVVLIHCQEKFNKKFILKFKRAYIGYQDEAVNNSNYICSVSTGYTVIPNLMTVWYRWLDTRYTSTANKQVFILQNTFIFIKGSVHEKLMGVQAYVEKYSIVVATNFTSICCVYKEKIDKNYSCRRTQNPYKFRKLQYSSRIIKNQFNSKQIIQILQRDIYNFFPTAFVYS